MAAISTFRVPLKSSFQTKSDSADQQTGKRIASALEKLDFWIESQGFRGWDPHDALKSPVIRKLTGQNRLAGIVWLQLLKRSPLNFRGLLAVPKDYNPKGMGLFLASYSRKYKITGDDRHRATVSFLARWLLENVEQGYSGLSWGYNFDWPNRSFFAPAGTPTVVNTAFIALAFLDMHLLLGKDLQWSNIVCESKNSDDKSNLVADFTSALDVARSACDFILQDLNVFRSMDELCFSYTPLDHRLVHNANMLGACLLAMVFKETGEPHLREAALAAARFTARRQLQNGAWPYGEAANDRWVDNFHTGFVLLSLKHLTKCLHTDEFENTLLNGYGFWKDQMFLSDGTPKYYPDRIYPIDVHSVAQAILTFLAFRQEDANAVEQATQVAQWGIKNLQGPSGYFYYQIHRNYSIRIPYIRWAQAWMQRALTDIVSTIIHDSKQN